MHSKALKKIFKNPTAVVCIVILAVLILSCVFSDVLAPYGFDEQQLHNARQGPSAEHIFGTDEYGRDIFSRILYGGKTSIVIGFAAVVLSVVVGGTLGMLAGYYKKAEAIIMPATDGDFSVHVGHEPAAVAVDPGTARFCVEGQWKEVIVGQGFAEVMPDYVILMASSAERPEEIDKARAERSRQMAEERLRQKQSVQEYYRSKTALARAMARLKGAK